jgi:hypothetical protein
MMAQRVMVLAIFGQHKLYATLTDFLTIVGYWTGDLHDRDPAIEQKTDHEYIPRVLVVCGGGRAPVFP